MIVFSCNAVNRHIYATLAALDKLQVELEYVILQDDAGLSAVQPARERILTLLYEHLFKYVLVNVGGYCLKIVLL